MYSDYTHRKYEAMKYIAIIAAGILFTHLLAEVLISVLGWLVLPLAASVFIALALSAYKGLQAR